MKRTYALKRLLEHGSMDLTSIAACTRWSQHDVRIAVRCCLKTGVIRRVRPTQNASPHAKFEYEAVV